MNKLQVLRALIGTAAVVGWFSIAHPTAPLIFTGLVSVLIVVALELYRESS